MAITPPLSSTGVRVRPRLLVISITLICDLRHGLLWRIATSLWLLNLERGKTATRIPIRSCGAADHITGCTCNNLLPALRQGNWGAEDCAFFPAPLPSPHV